jgi:2-dehydro-3-deoxyphosphogluconate aldolase/(4S)-4-hydroxy-2-oxoglutarate aldolase
MPDPSIVTMDALQRIEDTGAIGILRGLDYESTFDVVEAVSAGGVTAVEITANTPGAIDTIRALAEDIDGSRTSIGVGTVLDPETARLAILAGAEFVVTPTLNVDVIETCTRYDVPVVPGVFTPTEAITAFEAGADLCKVFPASTAGPGHVRGIRGPLPQIPLVPTGGVSVENAPAYFEAGATAVGVGSSLVDTDAIRTNEYDEIERTAARLVQLAEKHRLDDLKPVT